MAEGDEQVVQEHREFVHRLAHRVAAEFSMEHELEDLRAAGFRGLLEAHRRFDPSLGLQFRTFAYYRVRGAMIDEIRQQGHLPAKIHARLTAARAIDYVTEELGENRATTREQEDSTTQLAILERTLHRITAASVISALGQADPEADERKPEAAALARDTRARVRAVVDALPERERAIIEGVYFEEKSIKEVADSLSVSPSWMSRLHSATLDRLQAMLRELADEPPDEPEE